MRKRVKIAPYLEEGPTVAGVQLRGHLLFVVLGRSGLGALWRVGQEVLIPHQGRLGGMPL